ncbi:MAG TPA: hypothetical protein DDZ80_26930 [Cyanobacteria bacterium UBA8803]|nr:hypothetical protein [Cyanobacteria bacterium UBA9273]HBL61912.1 hypothetical protein [Cyanobacteria bacterium UBA8803]
MYYISDWAILNDTTSKQLQRILSEFHHLTESEIRLGCLLLESYHAVCRRDRLAQRLKRLEVGKSRILPPTASQLEEMAERLNAKAGLSLEPQKVEYQLQALARRLRQYHVYVRKNSSATAFLEQSSDRPKHDPIQSDDSINNGCTPFYIF